VMTISAVTRLQSSRIRTTCCCLPIGVATSWSHAQGQGSVSDRPCSNTRVVMIAARLHYTGNSLSAATCLFTKINIASHGKKHIP
jgi:hypothetical protein